MEEGGGLNAVTKVFTEIRASQPVQAKAPQTAAGSGPGGRTFQGGLSYMCPLLTRRSQCGCRNERLSSGSHMCWSCAGFRDQSRHFARIRHQPISETPQRPSQKWLLWLLKVGTLQSLQAVDNGRSGRQTHRRRRALGSRVKAPGLVEMISERVQRLIKERQRKRSFSGYKANESFRF